MLGMSFIISAILTANNTAIAPMIISAKRGPRQSLLRIQLHPVAIREEKDMIEGRVAEEDAFNISVVRRG
jgi:hypothetical protein